MFENGNKLKGYMNKMSKEHEIHSNYAWNWYFSRIFLELLYENPKVNFVLKGSISQLCSLKKITRPITDIDIVTFDRMENAIESVNRVVEQNNKIKFNIKNNFETDRGTINYKILGDFDSKTSLISLDIKKELVLDPIKTKIPIVFEKDALIDVNAISLEEHLANKIYVILLHLELCKNSSRKFRRFKDFYDVHRILSLGDIDEYKVMDLVAYKINHPAQIDESVLNTNQLKGPLFKNSFVNDNQKNWDSSKKELEFLNNVSFADAVEKTNDFISKGR